MMDAVDAPVDAAEAVQRVAAAGADAQRRSGDGV
jgi:hypothetical protein